MKPGIYNKIDINEYHADNGYISSTNLRKAAKSLAEFKYYIDNKEQEHKVHFDFGNAFELALLAPNEFDSKVANEKDIFSKIDAEKIRATKKYKEWKAKAIESNKYILPPTGSQSYESIEHMLISCHRDATIQRLIKNVDYQVSIFWKDKKTGLHLKTRPDIAILRKNIIVDVKTTVDGSPEHFSKDIANHDLAMQAVMQIDGVLASGLMSTVDMYLWLVVEKNPPYNATLYEFQKDDIEWVQTKYDITKKLISDAYKQGNFPGYTQRSENIHGILQAELPLWYRSID